MIVWWAAAVIAFATALVGFAVGIAARDWQQINREERFQRFPGDEPTVPAKHRGSW